MKDYFDCVLKHCKEEERAHIYICRYEDLVRDPEEELRNLFEFILSKKLSWNTNVVRRIEKVVAMGAEASKSYKLKDTTGKFNSHAHRYNEEQMQYIKDTLAEHLHFFNYATNPHSSDETGIFDFGDNDEHRDLFNGFRKLNTQNVGELDDMDQGHMDMPNKEYAINADTMYNIFDEEDLRRNQEPAKDHARKQFAAAAAEKKEGK